MGLGIVQYLLKNEGNVVIATARSIDGQAFKDLELKYPKTRFQLVQLDITDPESVANAVSLLTTSPLLADGLDYLVNNAGIHPQPFATFETLDLEAFQEEVLFNTVVPVRLTRAFLPLIKKSREKKVIFVTSAMGSFERTWPLVNECNSYSVGKAALNMVARKWGASLKYDGISVAAIHPGWVKTEIGDALLQWMDKNAPQVSQLGVEESAAGVVKVSEALVLEKTGEFWNYDGTTLPW